jgi:rSAM/selenodomain-associated transferase 1
MTHQLIQPGTYRSRDSLRSAFALMAKAPRIGSVKTRLVPPLASAEAAELSRCFIRDMARSISRVGQHRDIAGVVAFTPAEDAAAFDGLLPGDFLLLPQRGADLGERLLHATEDLLGAGFAATCLINADSPNLPQVRLAEAATLLRRPGDRVVLGEADDGGYYLIGLKHAHRRMFERIDWSTARVFGQSLERAADIGLEVARLAPWYDIDDAASLRRLYRELMEFPESAGSNPAPATANFLRELAMKNDAVGALLAGGPEKVKPS